MISRTAVVTLLWLFAAVAIGQHPDAAAAYADRAKYCQPHEYDHVYYLTTRPLIGDERTDLERAMKLVTAQTSRQQIIERCVPVQINDNLWRIDLRQLLWRYEDWQYVLKKQPRPYPYYDPDKMPLIVKADWYLAQMSDLQSSDSYFRLFFGGKIPTKRDEILKDFGVGWEPLLTWGMIEGASGVSVQGTRLLQSFPVPRGYAWGTRDILEITTEKDFVEHLDLKSPHDGEEWILSLLKMSKTANVRGFLQFYFLSNGKGEIVKRAPVDLVEDKTAFRGYREIRAPGSCIQCHQTGLNMPTENAVRKIIDEGANIYADYESLDQVEAFHLGELKPEILHNNDGYQTMVTLVCGCTSIEASDSFKAAINRYDAPLDLLATAEDAYLTVEQWTRTLANNENLPARLAALPTGGVISREAWEEYFVDAMYAAKGERKITKR